MKKAILSVALAASIALCGCTEASRVNHNISQQAKNFNVTRRLSVVNARTDTPMLEIIGNMDISNNSNNELVVTIELPDGTYKKHYVYQDAGKSGVHRLFAAYPSSRSERPIQCRHGNQHGTA